MLCKAWGDMLETEEDHCNWSPGLLLSLVMPLGVRMAFSCMSGMSDK